MGERLSLDFSTVSTVIGGLFTLASFIVQRASPVFLGVSFGSPSQEALSLGRLAWQGRIKTLISKIGSGYWGPGRQLNPAEIYQLTERVNEALYNEKRQTLGQKKTRRQKWWRGGQKAGKCQGKLDASGNAIWGNYYCFAYVNWDVTGYRCLFCPLISPLVTGDWGGYRGSKAELGGRVFIA